MISKQYKALVFDFAGVITEDGLQKKLKEFEKRYNLPNLNVVHKKHWYDLSLGKISAYDYWIRIFKEYGRSMPFGRIKRLNEEVIAAHVPRKEVFYLIKNLKNIKKCLITNTCKEWFEAWNRKFKLNNIFDIIVKSYEERLRKPDPRIYKRMLEYLHLQPSKVLYIDDRIENVQTARKLGIHTHLYSSTLIQRLSLD